MVKIISTHVLLGDERSGDIYGWGTCNPDMGEPMKIHSESETRDIIQKRVRRKKLRDMERDSQGMGSR